ncbi:MAG: hypothetical protein FJY29_07900 [Betaproteobacteria bacterium]|nr:hypothetical protein [Betaproteobacteria bacterium]
MKLVRSNFEIKTRIWASVSCAVVAGTLFALSACGALSSKERDETPSALMLKAQAAYDTGKYSEAIEHLNKVVAKDTSNQEARVRLAFALNASIGVTPLNLLKSLTAGNTSGGGSTNSDLNKLTSGAGLSKTKTEDIKRQRAALTDINKLRQLFPDFQVFQDAFLTLCTLLSQQTLSDLRAKSPSAVDLMQVDKCNEGVAVSNANVSIAALTLAIDQFATLYNSVLDSNGDGQIDVQKDAQDASDKLSTLNAGAGGSAAALATLNNATQTLTTVSATLKGDVFKLATAQFSIISSVIRGSNLPTSIATPLEKAVSALESSLSKINEYLDSGKTTGSVTTSGQAAATAANNANIKADQLLQGKTAAEKQDTCKNVYCLRSGYGLPNGEADMPIECRSVTYSKTCTQ